MDWGTPQQAKENAGFCESGDRRFFACVYTQALLAGYSAIKKLQKIGSVFPGPVEALEVLCYHYNVSLWVRVMKRQTGTRQ